jgi:hypothetical protein
MLNLRAYRGCPGIANHSLLLRRRPRLNAAASTVVTHSIGSLVRNIVVINVVNHRYIHIRYRAIVLHPAVIPISAIVSAARISIAVIDTAVIADVRTPVAAMPMVGAAIVTPPGRRPQRAHIRSYDPRTGNPVIARTRVAPVSRSPKVIVAGSRRLAVIGQRRWWF